MEKPQSSSKNGIPLRVKLRKLLPVSKTTPVSNMTSSKRSSKKVYLQCKFCTGDFAVEIFVCLSGFYKILII